MSLYAKKASGRITSDCAVQKMHSAMMDIRWNCGNGPTFTEHRKKVAEEVLNIPNDIRIDDKFETRCPQALRTPFLDILYKTFKKIAENADDGMLCRFLADHAHNIPHCFIRTRGDEPMTSWSINYYWICERPVIQYGLRGGNSQKKDYGPKWYKDLFAKEWNAILSNYKWEDNVKEDEVNELITVDWAGFNPRKVKALQCQCLGIDAFAAYGKKANEKKVAVKKEDMDEEDKENGSEGPKQAGRASTNDTDVVFKQETDDEEEAKESKDTHSGWKKGFLL